MSLVAFYLLLAAVFETSKCIDLSFLRVIKLCFTRGMKGLAADRRISFITRSGVCMHQFDRTEFRIYLSWRITHFFRYSTTYVGLN